MLEDYCSKLQQLNKQKNDFLKLKIKTNAKSLIDKQQNKYHKYILSQISHKNKLDSLFKLNQAINRINFKLKRPLFDALSNKNHRRFNQQNQSAENFYINEGRLTNSVLHHRQDEMINTISILKSKLTMSACNLLSKFLLNQQRINITQSFKQIKRKNEIYKRIQSLFYLIESKNQFHKNVFFLKTSLLKENIPKKVQNENRQNKSFIFSLNEFSEIIPYTIQQESEQLSTSGMKNIDEIDMKFKPISQSRIQETEVIKNNKNEYNFLFQSFEKLKQQVVIMKNLLTQKNKQIKLKDEQIYKTKKQYEKKIQSLHDEISQKIQKEYKFRDSIASNSQAKNDKHNSSYVKQLQAHIIGDRSPRGNIQEEDNLNSQLLQKYMKESFQMREKMDMAREMCEQFEFDCRTQEGQVMIEIVKLLTPEERLNSVVD